MTRTRVAAVLALAGGLVAAPAEASWYAAAPSEVTAFGCTATRTTADAVAGADGVARGFVRAEGPGCGTALRFFARAAAGWQAVAAPYAGRVLGVADDGTTTYVLYAAADGTRLGGRTRSGTWAASRRLSAAVARSGDVTAYAGRWWAVWSEPNAAGASLYQARTAATPVGRQRVTFAPRTDDRPSLVRLSDATYALAWQRYDPATRRTDVHRARSAGGAWSFARVTANGASTAPALAAYGRRQLLAWQRGGRVYYADDTAGAWSSRVLTTPGTQPRVAGSGGHVFVAWTSASGNGVLAERSGAVWTERNVTPGAAGGRVLAVTAAAGDATVFVGEPARLVARRQARPPVTAFQHLGAWVDLFDGALPPAASVAAMKANGVRTLYLETARYDSPAAVMPYTAAWLDAAKAAGLRAVAWYLAGYSEHLATDVARTVAAARYTTPAGRRFDAVAVDAEWRGASSTGAEFNAGVAEQLRRVRAGLGPAYPVGAIVPSPVGMSLNPALWEGYPWAAVGRYADVVLPMAYWSYRTDCATVPSHCAGPYTRDNVALARRHTGLPVHVIGGVADDVTAAEVAAYTDAALAGRSLGGSLYDFATTGAALWAPLRPLSP